MHPRPYTMLLGCLLSDDSHWILSIRIKKTVLGCENRFHRQTCIEPSSFRRRPFRLPFAIPVEHEEDNKAHWTSIPCRLLQQSWRYLLNEYRSCTNHLTVDINYIATAQITLICTPSFMSDAAIIIAFMPLAQTLFTVVAGAVTGIPSMTMSRYESSTTKMDTCFERCLSCRRLSNVGGENVAHVHNVYVTSLDLGARERT